MTAPELIETTRYLVVVGALSSLASIGALDMVLSVIKRSVDTILYSRI